MYIIMSMIRYLFTHSKFFLKNDSQRERSTTIIRQNKTTTIVCIMKQPNHLDDYCSWEMTVLIGKII